MRTRNMKKDTKTDGHVQCFFLLNVTLWSGVQDFIRRVLPPTFGVAAVQVQLVGYTL